MIELCPSSGKRVAPNTFVRCVCGCFWYGPDYPPTEGPKRKIVDEIPWHNVKGHLINRDKWERRMRQAVISEKEIINHFKEKTEDTRRFNVAVASESLQTMKRKQVSNG